MAASVEHFGITMEFLAAMECRVILSWIAESFRLPPPSFRFQFWEVKGFRRRFLNQPRSLATTIRFGTKQE
ncbi:hypothetical protein V2J09_001459 [Rumex salicifolius]